MPDHDVDAGGGGGGGDGTQCTNHPYVNTSSPGGICALCLQDKLGKLVSSSSSSFLPTSSPSFRSLSSTSTSSTLTLHPLPSLSSQPHHQSVSDVTMRSSHNASGSHFPYLLSHHTKKSSTDVSDVVLKRSQSSATPSSIPYNEGLTPRRKGFSSFLHLSSAHYKQQDQPKVGTTQTEVTQLGLHERVWRSRSIGCGSRSFSYDFFDRISTGFADCALRRVESNREGRRSSTSSARDILCGGRFGGFIITSSFSSSSSSS